MMTLRKWFSLAGAAAGLVYPCWAEPRWFDVTASAPRYPAYR